MSNAVALIILLIGRGNAAVDAALTFKLAIAFMIVIVALFTAFCSFLPHIFYPRSCYSFSFCPFALDSVFIASK